MSDSRVTEIEGAEMVKLTTVGGLIEAEIELVVRPLIGKPSTNDLLLRNHNIL